MSEATHSARYPSLEGKRVVVSGGGSGIGAGFVQGFAAQGARVLFCDIAEEPSRALVESIGGADRPIFLKLDLSAEDAGDRLIGAAKEELGGIDVLLNNAASDDRHSVEEVTPAYWHDRLAVNLRHLYFAARAAAPLMAAQGGGSIVNMGSISWHLGLRDLSIYEIAKAGIEGMTAALSREFGRMGIRVNTIVPGNVQTPRQSKWYTPEGEAEIVAAQCLDGRIQPGDIAAMALFLASDDARFCTGHNYWVDAGWR